MKAIATFLIIGLGLISFTASAFAQHRFDVTIEGPWILYELKKFDGTNSMLLVMAPSVPGHHPPVFTTGDGGPITALGIYCVAFGGTCQANAKPFPQTTGGTGSYDQTTLLPVKVYGNNLAWSTIQSNSTSFLLPMPDSISNDGIDPNITLRSDFGTYTSSTPLSIGVQLHYSNGPSAFNLLTCGTIAPPAASCTTPALSGSTLNNSGTLRITMKAEEHTDAQDPCDYHVRMAYHSMLMLLDPTPIQQHPSAGGSQNVNQSIAYMEHNDTRIAIDNCRRCDPQLDSIPSSCAYGTSYGHVQMRGPAAATVGSERPIFAPEATPSTPPDLGVQLASLDKLLSALNGQLQLSAARGQDVATEAARAQKSFNKQALVANLDPESCSEPDAKLPDLQGKFPTISQLRCVERYLESKATELQKRQCRNVTAMQNGVVSLPCDDARNTALVQIRGMLTDVQRTTKSGTSGKDCRAAVMIVQIQ
jgi:hypothetical protein